jgi:hypothetical protein
MDANTITVVITAIGVCVAIWIGVQQNERARLSQEITILSQLDARFDGPDFRGTRRVAAQWLLAGSPESDLAGYAAVRTVVNCFETLAYLHRKQVVSAESAWHYFGSWMFPYHEACKAFLRREQTADPNCYTEFFSLREAVFQVERESRNYTGTEQVLSPANVRRILEREASYV